MQLSSTKLLAQAVYNPQISAALRNISGWDFINGILPRLILLGFIIGAVAFFFMLLLGGVAWISSAGDKQKIEDARRKILHAFIGLFILFLLFVIVRIINTFFGICIGGLCGGGSGPLPLSPGAPGCRISGSAYGNNTFVPMQFYAECQDLDGDLTRIELFYSDYNNPDHFVEFAQCDSPSPTGQYSCTGNLTINQAGEFVVTVNGYSSTGDCSGNPWCQWGPYQTLRNCSPFEDCNPRINSDYIHIYVTDSGSLPGTCADSSGSCSCSCPANYTPINSQQCTTGYPGCVGTQCTCVPIAVPGTCGDTNGACGCICPNGYIPLNSQCSAATGTCMGSCSCVPNTPPNAQCGDPCGDVAVGWEGFLFSWPYVYSSTFNTPVIDFTSGYYNSIGLLADSIYLGSGTEMHAQGTYQTTTGGIYDNGEVEIRYWRGDPDGPSNGYAYSWPINDNGDVEYGTQTVRSLGSFQNYVDNPFGFTQAHSVGVVQTIGGGIGFGQVYTFYWAGDLNSESYGWVTVRNIQANGTVNLDAPPDSISPSPPATPIALTAHPHFGNLGNATMTQMHSQSTVETTYGGLNGVGEIIMGIWKGTPGGTSYGWNCYYEIDTNGIVDWSAPHHCSALSIDQFPGDGNRMSSQSTIQILKNGSTSGDWGSLLIGYWRERMFFGVTCENPLQCVNNICINNACPSDPTCACSALP
jgi:hypothetical protein